MDLTSILQVVHSVVESALIVWAFKFAYDYSRLKTEHAAHAAFIETHSRENVAMMNAMAEQRGKIESLNIQHNGMNDWMRNIDGKIEVMNNLLQRLVGASEKNA